MSKAKPTLKLLQVDFREKVVVKSKPISHVKPGVDGWDVRIDGPIVVLTHAEKGLVVEVPRSYCIVISEVVPPKAKAIKKQPAKTEPKVPPPPSETAEETESSNRVPPGGQEPSEQKPAEEGQKEEAQ